MRRICNRKGSRKRDTWNKSAPQYTAFHQKEHPRGRSACSLEAASWAPSEHNEQPWRFVVVRGDARKEVVRALKEGIKRNRSDKAAILERVWKYIPAAIYTVRVLEQAPVIVFFINSKGKDYYGEFPIDEHLMEMADIQSVSAAIQNMCLEATARNIGTLWTCNIFFAYDELKNGWMWKGKWWRPSPWGTQTEKSNRSRGNCFPKRWPTAVNIRRKNKTAAICHACEASRKGCFFVLLHKSFC